MRLFVTLAFGHILFIDRVANIYPLEAQECFFAFAIHWFRFVAFVKLLPFGVYMLT